METYGAIRGRETQARPAAVRQGGCRLIGRGGGGGGKGGGGKRRDNNTEGREVYLGLRKNSKRGTLAILA